MSGIDLEFYIKIPKFLNILLTRELNLFCSVTVVQSGTDYKPFIQTIGVPCLDIRYLYDKV